MKLLLDANFLIYCTKHKIDLLDELSKFGKPEMFVLRSVLKELESIAEGKGEDGRAARLALDFVEEKTRTLNTGGKPDAELVSRAGEYVVCTNDRGVIRGVKKAGGRIVAVRGKKMLMMF